VVAKDKNIQEMDQMGLTQKQLSFLHDVIDVRIHQALQQPSLKRPASSLPTIPTKKAKK
jgi:hypothetical protein